MVNGAERCNLAFIANESKIILDNLNRSVREYIIKENSGCQIDSIFDDAVASSNPGLGISSTFDVKPKNTSYATFDNKNLPSIGRITPEDNKLKGILHNYVQTSAYDNNGYQIKRFANNARENERKFLMDNVFEAANNEGIEAKLVLAIIQKENGFDGSYVNKNGKGYMALTGIAIEDTVMNPKRLNGIIDLYKEYADEIGLTEQDIEFLENPKTKKYEQSYDNSGNPIYKNGKPKNKLTKKAKEIYDKIVTYLNKNEGNRTRSFNIKIGTKILAYHIKRIKSDVQNNNETLTKKQIYWRVARNYNGSDKKKLYADRTIKILDQMDEFIMFNDDERILIAGK